MKKRSLFQKIFLWFLAAMAVIFLLAVFSAYFTHEGMTRGTLRNDMTQVLDEYAPRVMEVLEAEGDFGLESFLRTTQRQIPGRMALFYPNGKSVTAKARKEPPPGSIPEEYTRRLERFITRTAAEDKDMFSVFRKMALLARKVTSPSGDIYVLALMRFIPPPLPSENITFFILILFLITGAGAGACYWLANHISIPVRKLRSAALDLAGGDLSRRVDRELLRRKDELGELAQSFNGMAEKLEELVTSQRRLIRDISHELRSPLTRLNIALELTRKKTHPDCEEHLKRIEKEAEELNVMISSLLSLSRLETCSKEMKITRFDLAEMIREVAEDGNFEAVAKNAMVELVSMKDVFIDGDPDIFRRALENIIRNAVRHTAPGTGVEISLQEDLPGGYLHITIRDHGPGLPEEELEKIFQPFYRFEEARDRETGGAGIGLAIARRSIDLHKGNIRASNAPDGGLILTIFLPLGK